MLRALGNRLRARASARPAADGYHTGATMWAIAASAQLLAPGGPARAEQFGTGDVGIEVRIANRMNHAEGKQFLMISLPRFAKSATVFLVNDGSRVYFACFRETLPGSGRVLI